ncbi:hypothetical protein Tco_0071394 [Tanacetum coccineum]
MLMVEMGGNNGCSYKTFLACNPRYYDVKGGAIALTRWIEKIESVIENSRCAENQKARGREAAIGMSWVDFKALHVEEFCPSNEMEKLESEFWNHTMVGANHAGITDSVLNASGANHTTMIRRVQFLRLGILICMRQVPLCVHEGVVRKERKWEKQVNKEKVDLAGCVSTVRNRVTLSEIVRHRLNRWRQLVLLEWEIIKGFVMNVGALNIFAILILIDALQDPNIVMGTFSLNDHFATVLFDSGADFSFIIHVCCPYTYFVLYPRIVSPSTYQSDSTMPLSRQALIQVDRIIRMDWLSKNKAEIVCYEKVVRIPLEGGKILRVQGELTLGGIKTLMSTKVDEPELSDIPIVRDFIDVFLEDLSGLPPQRQVEFRIDLIPGATPVAKSPYRLAPSKMQELSE